MRLVLIIVATAAIAACQPAAKDQPAPQVSDVTAVVAVAENFTALGNEPFWSVEVSPGQLRYSTPDNIPGDSFAAQQKQDAGGITFSGTLAGQPAALTITVGQCSDGMSDTVYAYRAAFTVAGKALNGCARKR